MLKKISSKFERHGISGIFNATLRRIVPVRLLKDFETIRTHFDAKRGLEIGGPSPRFSRRGYIPIYPIAANIDNCNFSDNTVWEGQITEGRSFVFDPAKPPGHQYTIDATDLSQIQNDTYDFLISSHTLEHTANPLRALTEWIRVLRPGGTMTIVLPHKDGTFDHRRPVTALEHLIDDFNNATGEDDLTHLQEILELHDLSRDPGAGSVEQFRQRSMNNFENRCLHHHVFNTPLVLAIADHMALKILNVEARKPYDIVVVAQKPAADMKPDNWAFLNSPRNWDSPFPSDTLERART